MKKAQIEGEMSPWFLDYTSHLGYLPPAFRPQFASTVASPKLADHVRYAAALGMTGIAYPWAIEKPAAEVSEVRNALVETGLACSHVVVLPLATAPSIWSDRSRSSVVRAEAGTASAAEKAVSLRCSVLVALVTRDPDRPADEVQFEDVASNLGGMARIAADYGLTLDVEPMSALPGLLIQTTSQALDVIARAENEALGMVFDTGHAASMPGDPIDLLEDAFEHIHLIQLSDMPGRVEPGAGTLPIAEVCAAARRRGYSGLVDFEHLWRDPSRAGEAAGLERLRELDGKIELLSLSPDR